MILDNSTLVSAALRPGSIPHRVLLLAVDECEVCASIDSLSELEEVLARPKFDGYLSSQTRGEFLALVHENFRIFSVHATDFADLYPCCRDPRDDKFLALALVAQADVIVSSDDDLLVLHPWRGIPILSPAEFLVRDRVSHESDQGE